MQDWQLQGSHYYRVDGDTVRWRCHGTVTIPDLDVMFTIWERLTREYGASFTILDIREDVSVPAASRRYVGVRSRTVPTTGMTAIVGASFMIRTVIQLMNNASRLLGNTLPAAYFCSTLEEAEVWLGKVRKQSAKNS